MDYHTGGEPSRIVPQPPVEVLGRTVAGAARFSRWATRWWTGCGGLPRINAVYVLFDGVTLRPVALLDGSALTTLRTPAVSVAAIRQSLPPGPLRVVVYGTGPAPVRKERATSPR